MSRRQYPAGLAALAQRPGRGRERGFGDSPFDVGHVRGVPGRPGTAANPARTAPARYGRRNLGMRGFRWFVDLHKSRSWNPRSPVPGSDTCRSVYGSLTVCCPRRSAARARHPRGAFPNRLLAPQVRGQPRAKATQDVLTELLRREHRPSTPPWAPSAPALKQPPPARSATAPPAMST